MVRKKKDIVFRYTADMSSPDAVLLSYLSSELDGKRMMLQAARICYLALAYKQAATMEPERLRQLALNSCDALEKHIFYIRASFGLLSSEPLTQILPNKLEATDKIENKLAFANQPQLQSQLPLQSDVGEVTPADVDALFNGI